jgi:predicted acylesterase/phospholipase RssA
LSAPEKLKAVDCLALEGGGYLGHAYVGILERLETWGIRPRELAGTSAGAITAMLLALDLPASKVRELQENTPWDRFSGYRFGALYRLLRLGGWHSMDYAREWIAGTIDAAGLDPTVTFGQLRRISGRSLSVAATRYYRGLDGTTHAEPRIFSPAETPDVQVADAVAASMAVPIFYPPVEIDGFWYADGGVAVNHPLHLFGDRPPEEILGLRVDQSSEIVSRAVLGEPVRPGVPSQLRSLTSMLRDLTCRSYVPSALWPRVVRIDVGKERALDFSGGKARALALRKAGLRALETWLVS